MALKAIVSYDGTANDQDALALAKLLAAGGAELTLAYVRHSTRSEQSREQLEEHEANALLQRGVVALGEHEVSTRVVLSPSTGEGLRQLADEIGAGLIVFGSDYRTAPGHVLPGRTAQTLLEGGRTAIAVAPAEYRITAAGRVSTIGLLGNSDDPAVAETASSFAESLEAKPVSVARQADLLIVGSRAEAREGQVLLSAQTQNALEDAAAPVVVLARGTALDLPLLATA